MRFLLIIPAMLVCMAASLAGAPEARAASVTPSVAPVATQDVATPVHYRRHRRHYRHYGGYSPYYGYGPGYYGYGSPFFFSFGHRRHYGHRRWRHGGYGYGHRRHYGRGW